MSIFLIDIITGREYILTGNISTGISVQSNIISSESGITSNMLTSGIVRVVGVSGGTIINATPSISNGYDGQIIIIKGESNINTVTLKSNNNLIGSNLMLDNGIDFTLGKGDLLQLYYDASDGCWYEISRKNNI